MLKAFDGAHKTLVIESQQAASVTLDFDALRYLAFSRCLLTETESAATRAQAAAHQATNTAVAAADKSFELVYRDGKKLHASAETILLDAIGLHIFLDKTDGHVYRLFAPNTTLEKYSANNALVQTVAEHRMAHPMHEAVHAAVVGQVKDGPHLASSPAPGSIRTLPPATCRSELIERLEDRWPLPAQRLGELLLAQGLITYKQLDDALAYKQRLPEKRIAEILVQKGVANADDIYGILAFKLGLHFVKLGAFDIDSASLTHFPRELAIRFHVLPLFVHHHLLVVAMSDPTNFDACKMVEFVTQHRIEAVMAQHEDIEAAIDKFYGQQEDDEAIEEFSENGAAGGENEEGLTKEAARLSQEKPIVRLVHNMIIEAVHRRASDIHIRPGEKAVDIILRIDGTLIPVRNFTKSILAAVVSRIKIIGRMDISERRIPQDGRASTNIYGNKVDLRISVMPTINGESVVIRILDTMAGLRNIDELGFNDHDHHLFKDMISHSYGILLVTGPTGSGKSTTLYAALEHIRKSNVNIITAEDPVEYHIDGIEQMQVNHQIDYSFARILRNILRHDPDVIMVGEIRDQETAKTAIESALTGHLVLSTLHTNSAAVTVTRLLEMGVEPYLINDTLLGVLAQRLVRANCPLCLEEEAVDPVVNQALGVDSKEKFYRGKGCESCNNTGYKGRLAVYELLQMNQAIRSHVLNGVSADIIHAEAVSNGMTVLTRNALNAAREKKTSLAEVYRIRLE
ncbi:MAG: GspE/PulE family protein [Gammaproteobacteria bacterium]|nr:GspE/PulE family protein [Gammaproteobacteria bacterium]